VIVPPTGYGYIPHSGQRKDRTHAESEQEPEQSEQPESEQPEQSEQVPEQQSESEPAEGTV
jgi:hypothetical protein